MKTKINLLISISLISMLITGCGGTFIYPKVQSLNNFKNIEKYNEVGIVGISKDNLTNTSKIFYAKYLKEIGIQPILCTNPKTCEANIIVLINASNSSTTEQWSYSTPASYYGTSNTYNNGYGSATTNTTVTPIGGGSQSGSTTFHDTSISIEIIKKNTKKTLYSATANLENTDNPLNLVEETTLYILNDWLYKNTAYQQRLNELNIKFYNMHPNWSDGKSPLHLQIKKQPSD